MNVLLNKLWQSWCRFSCWGVEQHSMLELVVASRFKDSMMSVITCVVASVFYILYYDFVRQNGLYIALLLVWFVDTLSYHVIAQDLQRKKKRGMVFTDTQLRHYVGITVLISVWQALAVSIMAIAALAYGANGLNSPAVIGSVLFYIGLSMIVFVCVTSVWLANMILVLPLVLYFCLFGGENEWLIAGFLVLLMLAMWSFSSTQRDAFIQQVEQKNQLETLSDALKIEKNRAESANQAKSHFFTSASHDARQPLQAISLLSESLIRSNHLHDQDRRLVEKISANLHAIRNLFNRVLDISRIEAGSLQPQMQPVSLMDVFDHLSQQYGEIASNNQLWLHFAPTCAMVWHDPELLQRMLGNIIHNALKFTKQGGVWVGYRAQRGCIEIRDSGIGIAAQAQAVIFEDFYQLNNSERSRDSNAGVGLGLSIVNRLAHLTDTRVTLRSAPQRGSVFSLHCSAWHGEIDHHAHAADVVLSVHEVSNEPPQQLLAGVRVLYVEDDDELRDLLTQALTEQGAQMMAFAGLQEADVFLKTAIVKKPQILLTDYRLPNGQTGVSVTQSVRHTLGHTLPTIILTGDTQAHNDISLNALCNLTILQKPVMTHKLIASLRESLGVCLNPPEAIDKSFSPCPL